MFTLVTVGLVIVPPQAHGQPMPRPADSCEHPVFKLPDDEAEFRLSTSAHGKHQPFAFSVQVFLTHRPDESRLFLQVHNTFNDLDARKHYNKVHLGECDTIGSFFIDTCRVDDAAQDLLSGIANSLSLTLPKSVTAHTYSSDEFDQSSVHRAHYEVSLIEGGCVVKRTVSTEDVTLDSSPHSQPLGVFRVDEFRFQIRDKCEFIFMEATSKVKRRLDPEANPASFNSAFTRTMERERLLPFGENSWSSDTRLQYVRPAPAGVMEATYKRVKNSKEHLAVAQTFPVFIDRRQSQRLDATHGPKIALPEHLSAVDLMRSKACKEDPFTSVNTNCIKQVGEKIRRNERDVMEAEAWLKTSIEQGDCSFHTIDLLDALATARTQAAMAAHSRVLLHLAEHPVADTPIRASDGTATPRRSRTPWRDNAADSFDNFFQGAPSCLTQAIGTADGIAHAATLPTLLRLARDDSLSGAAVNEAANVLGIIVSALEEEHVMQRQTAHILRGVDTFKAQLKGAQQQPPKPHPAHQLLRSEARTRSLVANVSDYLVERVQNSLRAEHDLRTKIDRLLREPRRKAEQYWDRLDRARQSAVVLISTSLQAAIADCLKTDCSQYKDGAVDVLTRIAVKEGDQSAVFQKLESERRDKEAHTLATVGALANADDAERLLAFSSAFEGHSSPQVRAKYIHGLVSALQSKQRILVRTSSFFTTRTHAEAQQLEDAVLSVLRTSAEKLDFVSQIAVMDALAEGGVVRSDILLHLLSAMQHLEEPNSCLERCLRPCPPKDDSCQTYCNATCSLQRQMWNSALELMNRQKHLGVDIEEMIRHVDPQAEHAGSRKILQFSFTLIDLHIGHPRKFWYKKFGGRWVGAEALLDLENYARLWISLFDGSLKIHLRNEVKLRTWFVFWEYKILHTYLGFQYSSAYSFQAALDLVNKVANIVDDGINLVASAGSRITDLLSKWVDPLDAQLDKIKNLRDLFRQGNFGEVVEFLQSDALKPLAQFFSALHETAFDKVTDGVGELVETVLSTVTEVLDIEEITKLIATFEGYVDQANSTVIRTLTTVRDKAALLTTGIRNGVNLLNSHVDRFGDQVQSVYSFQAGFALDEPKLIDLRSALVRFVAASGNLLGPRSASLMLPSRALQANINAAIDSSESPLEVAEERLHEIKSVIFSHLASCESGSCSSVDVAAVTRGVEDLLDLSERLTTFKDAACHCGDALRNGAMLRMHAKLESIAGTKTANSAHKVGTDLQQQISTISASLLQWLSFASNSTNLVRFVRDPLNQGAQKLTNAMINFVEPLQSSLTSVAGMVHNASATLISKLESRTMKMVAYIHQHAEKVVNYLVSVLRKPVTITAEFAARLYSMILPSVRWVEDKILRWMRSVIVPITRDMPFGPSLARMVRKVDGFIRGIHSTFAIIEDVAELASNHTRLMAAKDALFDHLSEQATGLIHDLASAGITRLDEFHSDLLNFIDIERHLLDWKDMALNFVEEHLLGAAEVVSQIVVEIKATIEVLAEGLGVTVNDGPLVGAVSKSNAEALPAPTCEQVGGTCQTANRTPGGVVNPALGE